MRTLRNVSLDDKLDSASIYYRDKVNYISMAGWLAGKIRSHSNLDAIII